MSAQFENPMKFCKVLKMLCCQCGGQQSQSNNSTNVRKPIDLEKRKKTPNEHLF